MELFKRTNPTTTPKREVEQCTLAKKEDSGCQDKDTEDPEETGRQVEDLVPALEDGIAVASDSGESRQQIGVGQLSDVSHVANSGDTVGNHGEVKQKHSVKDLLLDQGTATNERVITRKCKHNQKRRFICNPIGEPDDETLKREALEAILQETKRAKMRADEYGPSGWLPNRTGKPNKRFLSRLLAQTGGASRSKSGRGSSHS